MGAVAVSNTVIMRIHGAMLVSGAALAMLSACATTTATTETYPVYRLASLSSEQAAWNAARERDQPVVILGSGIYGLHEKCIPVRYYAEASDARLTGSAVDGRLGGSAGDGRLTGSASDGRLGGSGSDGRLGGSGSDGRLGGSGTDGRLTGSASDGRLTGNAGDVRIYGGTQQARSFGADDAGRLFGATESNLRCVLAADGASIYIYGPSDGLTGYLYSARLGGRMEKVFLVRQ